MTITVRRLQKSLISDFYEIHSLKNEAGWCFCTAWWVDSWDGWDQRTASENSRLRADLFSRDIFDGYLLYLDEIPVGWCQVGQRDRLEKLVRQFDLVPDEATWAISCFLIVPCQRRKGLSEKFLRQIIADLAGRGVKRIEAFPKVGQELDTKELWNGPETNYWEAGFSLVRRHQNRLVLALDLNDCYRQRSRSDS